jgi:hypothetical protein
MLTTTDIGNALERAARTIAVLIAATMAAGFITRRARRDGLRLPATDTASAM